MGKLSHESMTISNYEHHFMPPNIARYKINCSVGSKFDMIVTLSGSNWSLGTTDRRFAKFYAGRRYNGAYNTAEIFGNGARFHGSVGNFNTSGVGFLIEQSDATNFIFQIHNAYSNGPTAGFEFHFEGYSCGKPTQLSTYTGGNYTSNPF